LDFAGPSECSMVEFKPGWLPFEPSDEFKKYNSNGGWYSELWVWDMAPENIPEEYRDFSIPYRADIYYSAQFAEGGNAILLYHTPEEITECEINGHKSLKFHATFSVNGYDFSYNYVILFNEEFGYMVVVTGNSDMEIIQKIAENMEFRTLEETISYEDFSQHNVFIDAGNG